MEDQLNLEIVSPEKVIFSERVNMVTIPSYEGDMSLLNNHIPIITFLRPGVIKVKKNDKDFQEFFVQEGTVEYFNDSLIILSASIIDIKNISKEFLDTLSKDTLTQLDSKEISDQDKYILNHKLDTLKDIRV